MYLGQNEVRTLAHIVDGPQSMNELVDVEWDALLFQCDVDFNSCRPIDQTDWDRETTRQMLRRQPSEKQISSTRMVSLAKISRHSVDTENTCATKMFNYSIDSAYNNLNGFDTSMLRSPNGSTNQR